MTVWVYRDGKIVPKPRRKRDPVSFPTPMLSRMEPFESPITGREITSWRERDADMAAVDAVDMRDMPRDHQWKRGREVQLKEAADARQSDPRQPDLFEWRGPEPQPS